MDRFESRRGKLRKALKKAGVEGLLVTNFANVTYLTGFSGDDSYLLVSQDKDIILSDARYTTQLEEECPGLEVNIRTSGVPMLKALGQTLAAAKIKTLGIEGSSMTVDFFNKLESKFSEVKLKATQSLVEDLRIIKDKEEIAATRQAVWQAEKAFSVVRATLRHDMSERLVAADIEHQIRQFGGKGCSFPPIVAVGARAALPHARPTGQLIGDAPFVLIDWGADEGLYKSDLTRVLVTGKIPPKLEAVYGVVLEAQLRAIEAIRPGVTCGSVDAVARQIIADAGYGKYFGHGLGHGLGLDIHESPRFAPDQERLLEPGMIVTVEPGIYLPGKLGVRIEDDVLVTKDGHEVLTSVPKSFEDAVLS